MPRMEPAAVADLHRRTAAAAAATDWRVAAYHYREAGDTDAVLKVVGEAIPTIMGKGQYALAETFIGPIPADLRPPGFDLILSRVDMQHGDYEAAIAASQAVLDSPATDPVQRDHALLNLVTLYFNSGDGDRALILAERLTEATDKNLASIAEVTVAIIRARTASDMDAINQRLRAMARDQRTDRTHHFGVTMANLAYNSIIQDRLQDAAKEVEEALDAFESASGLMERASATMAKAQILARLGHIQRASELIDSLLDADAGYLHTEAYAEAADTLDTYASRASALAILDRVGHQSTITKADRRLLALTTARLFLRQRRFVEAAEALADYPAGQPTLVGQEAFLAVTHAYLKVARGDQDAGKAANQATEQAAIQGADSIRRVGELLVGIASGIEALNQAIRTIGMSHPWHLTFLADLLAVRLASVSPESQDLLAHAAKLHPERWRTALREALDSEHGPNVAAARLLETIGDHSDIPRLRRLAKSGRRSSEATNLGRSLARRLAAPRNS